MTRFLQSVVVVFFLGALSFNALSCVHPPPKPKPKVWVENHGINPVTNKLEMWFGVEVDPTLFPITTPTVCTCGLGIGGVGLPIVPSLNVTMAGVGITNTITHDTTFLAAFNGFTQSAPITTNAINNAIIAGQQWQGFSQLVNPFTQPVLGPNEVLKLWFGIEIDVPDLGVFNTATEGEFAGFSVGGDPNDPAHPLEQFLGFRVPEPASLLLFWCGVLGLIIQRKLIG